MDGIAWIVDMRHTLDEQCKILTLSRHTIPRVDLGTCVLIREEVKCEIGETRRRQPLYF